MGMRIFILAGWLHLVNTIISGALVGYNLITIKNMKAIENIVLDKASQNNGDSDFATTLGNLVEVITEVLNNRDPNVGALSRKAMEIFTNPVITDQLKKTHWMLVIAKLMRIMVEQKLIVFCPCGTCLTL